MKRNSLSVAQKEMKTVSKELDTTEQLKQKPTSIATNSVESDVTWATPLSLESSFTLYVKENMIRTCSS